MMAIAPRDSCSRSSAGSQKRRKSSLWGRTSPTDDRSAYVSFKNLRAEVSDQVYCGSDVYLADAATIAPPMTISAPPTQMPRDGAWPKAKYAMACATTKKKTT